LIESKPNYHYEKMFMHRRIDDVDATSVCQL